MPSCAATDVAIQGIFITDPGLKLPYLNLKVTNNVVVGATFNGIDIDGAINPIVSGNVVLGTTTQQSWLAVSHSDGAVVTDNVATLVNNAADTNLTVGGNVLTTALTDQQLASLATNPILSGIYTVVPTSVGLAQTALAAASSVAHSATVTAQARSSRPQRWRTPA